MKGPGSSFLVTLAASAPGFSLLLQGLLTFHPSHLNSSKVSTRGKGAEDLSLLLRLSVIPAYVPMTKTEFQGQVECAVCSGWSRARQVSDTEEEGENGC